MNEEYVLQKIGAPLYEAKGWIKFAGIMSIIMGVLSILSIWGILICWLPIWMGVILCSASNYICTAFETNNEDAFRMSMAKMGTYFRIMGVFFIIYCVIIAIAIFVLIGVAIFNNF